MRPYGEENSGARCGRVLKRVPGPNSKERGYTARTAKAGSMNVSSHNRRAWDRLVEEGNRWTVPVSEAEIAEARPGRFNIS